MATIRTSISLPGLNAFRKSKSFGKYRVFPGRSFAGEIMHEPDGVPHKLTAPFCANFSRQFEDDDEHEDEILVATSLRCVPLRPFARDLKGARAQRYAGRYAKGRI
jgi:hypothetical protein